MNRALLLAAVAGIASTASARDQISPAQFGGHYYYNVATGQTWRDDSNHTSEIDLPGDVYNNTNPSSGANFGFSSTDFSSTWGDRVTTTGTGILDQNDFTVYNGTPTGGGSLLTASFNVRLYNATGGTLPGGGAPLMAGYTSGTVNFGAGLGPGFFSTVTITGIGFLGMNLSNTDVLMTTQVAAFTASAGLTRLGIASLGTNAPSVGSAGASPSTMYINSSTVGAEGYYNIGTAPNFLNANPGMRINIPAPASMALLGLGGLIASRRRRA